MEEETKIKGKEASLKRERAQRRALLTKPWLIIDTIVAWCLIYIQTTATDHAKGGKLVKGWRRRWVLFLYWLAHKLVKLRNYDDTSTATGKTDQGVS